MRQLSERFYVDIDVILVYGSIQDDIPFTGCGIEGAQSIQKVERIEKCCASALPFQSPCTPYPIWNKEEKET